jgi:RNA polymerase sigma factor (sigma-70 family)
LDDDFLADTYQDAIIRLWENIRRKSIQIENFTSDITAYLFGIAENVLREQLRKRKEVFLEELLEIPDYVGKYVKSFEINERNLAIRDLVDSMDSPCAPLLLKFYWEGYSMDEIAIQLGYANANSAKTQKNKCMNKLKAIFKSI